MRARPLGSLLGSLVGTALVASLLVATPGAPSAADPAPRTVEKHAQKTTQKTAQKKKVTTTNRCIRSVRDPRTKAPVKICYSLFKPPGASKRHPVPMIIHSHGFGGSRTTEAADFKPFTKAGYGVLSFDQRGFGESGGNAYVENPAYEGVDVRKLVQLVSRLSWVKQDGKGDPRLGAIGGSYGGGYQFLGAFEELRVKGRPVFDALAPEITWNDLNDSITPEGVVRTAWAVALSAGSLPSNALPPKIYQALIEGAALGQVPAGPEPLITDLPAFFEKNGPKWHTRHGRKLDIPVLFGQGTTDSLFPLEQGLTNWRTAITSRARKHSIFVGYNGGHVLPALFPRGVNVTSDPCSKRLAGAGFRHLSIRFFDEQLKGRDRGLRGYGKVHLATAKSTCTTVTSVEANRTLKIGTVATTTLAGLPLPYEVADGPIRIAGTPYLTGKVTTFVPDSRAFYGLAVGRTPLDAHLVQNNVLPIREPKAVQGKARHIELPSVAVNVPKGQHLYLLASPISDTFVAMGSRVPGVVSIANTAVHLPVVRR